MTAQGAGSSFMFGQVIKLQQVVICPSYPVGFGSIAESGTVNPATTTGYTEWITIGFK